MILIEARRYTFKLYPSKEQLAVLWRQRVMVGCLWNALLDRAEHIERTTVQRQTWVDRAGKPHTGISRHNDGSWRSFRKKEREDAVMAPLNGKPQHYNHYAMSNEITAMLNDRELAEWRGLSVWTCHETARHLDLAFKAFFRRLEEMSSPAAYERAAAAFIAKTGRNPTRYQLAGYPKRKNHRKPEGIPHRFASGCKLTKDPRHERSWKQSLKGVPGRIHAPGMFPLDITDWAGADVKWYDNHYWVSVGVEGDCSRDHGDQPLTIKFPTMGSFVEVNGCPMLCDDLVEVQRLQDQHDEMKAEHDTRYPRGKRRTDDQQREAVDSWRAISHLAAKISRTRRNALHVLTANWVADASELTVISPRISEHTQTARGGEKEWGAHTAIVSDLNRNTLSQAPATAVAMLKYKAREAGIDCPVVVEDEPDINAGAQLVEARKQARRMKRQVKRLSDLAA